MGLDEAPRSFRSLELYIICARARSTVQILDPGRIHLLLVASDPGVQRPNLGCQGPRLGRDSSLSREHVSETCLRSKAVSVSVELTLCALCLAMDARSHFAALGSVRWTDGPQGVEHDPAGLGHASESHPRAIAVRRCSLEERPTAPRSLRQHPSIAALGRRQDSSHP